MRRYALLFLALLPMLDLPACKTTGAKTASFTIDGDAREAHRLITKIVNANYANAPQATVEQFATALQNGTTKQAARSDLMLQEAYKKLNAADPEAPSEFDFYIISEFAALTNYATTLVKPGTALVYTGL